MYSRQEKKDIRLAFWVEFGQKSAQLKIRNRLGKHWLLHKTEISGVRLCFSVTDAFAQVAIELIMKPETERLRWFMKMEALRSKFEKAFGKALVWELNYNRENLRDTSRIFFQIDEVSILRKDQWDTIHSFLIDNMLKLERAWLRNKDLLKENEGDEFTV
jgi:hypothetical protein